MPQKVKFPLISAVIVRNNNIVFIVLLNMYTT